MREVGAARFAETADLLDRYVRRAKDEFIGEERLILRILSGDERAAYHAILDAGRGFQKGLIARCRMSDAKVSRALGRLEDGGFWPRSGGGDQPT